MGSSSKDKHHSSNKSSGSRTTSSRPSSNKHSKSKHSSDRNSNGEGSSRHAQDQIAERPEDQQEQQPAPGYWETRKICCNCQKGTDLQPNRHFGCFFCGHQIGDHCMDTSHWVSTLENELPTNYDPQFYQAASGPQQYENVQQPSYNWQE